MGKGSHGKGAGEPRHRAGCVARGCCVPSCHCVGTRQVWLPQPERHSHPGSKELRVAGKG